MRLALALLLVVACGSSPKPARTPEPRVVARIAYASFGIPVVHGSVAGKPAYLLLDTGAPMHVVSRRLAPNAEGLVRGTDIAGRAVGMARIDHPALAIDGWGPLRDGPAVVVDLPRELEQIDAIVSPQSLGENVVLDFPAGEMRREAHVAVGAPTCTYVSDGIEARVLAVDAVVDGLAVRLELDTGTNRLMVAKESNAGRAIARRELRREEGTGAAGGFAAETAQGVPVSIGDWSGALAVSITSEKPDARCNVSGRLGMERLRSCVVAIGARDVSLDCDQRGAQ